jgi:prepilin-type N-terminal cleavage/methylation domain-containing protein
VTGRRRAGFTLVEVLVGVVITGLVALLAHQLFGAAIDGSRRVQEARSQLDRASNARGLLRDAFLSLDVGADSAGPFDGRGDRMRFSTWMLTTDGWPERREVQLVLNQGRWTAVSGNVSVVLGDSIRWVAFDYLLAPGTDSGWVRESISPVSAPLAVRVRIRHLAGAIDTMLYLIKARG